ELCEIVPVFVVSGAAAFRRKIKLVPPLKFGFWRQWRLAGFMAADQISTHRNERLAARGPRAPPQCRPSALGTFVSVSLSGHYLRESRAMTAAALPRDTIANLRRDDGSLKRCHPHMFRDTFAVEMLVAGVPLEQVSILLGHKSVKITEKHYAPWVKARQEQLAANVRKAWSVLDTVSKTTKRKSQ